ncbi:Zinc resistance conferring protein [Marasmius tenuissimus]|nr:Zinc resistance conferring protein [Marasmius tenuissimus]
MGLSRATRIKTLLVIDTVFFFVELIVGYAIGSLALVADSFHMLNDVMSLLVALYAIKLTTENAVDSKYSYGWHRAEILAALVNGVFLLALCFSIFMEAIERFFSTPEISNPRLIIIVGSLGLASNIVGLFLFHEHPHSHPHSHPSTPPSESTSPLPEIEAPSTPKPIDIRHSHSRQRSSSQGAAFSPLYGHPAATRAALVRAAEDIAAETGEQSATPSNSDENTPLLRNSAPSHDHSSHSREPSHGHGHSHSHSGSMNMQGILLHVLGDALGNVGVIATGLVILLSSWEYKFYFDPTISLVITVIIFSSALPLVRSASFILLQAVPPHVSLDDVREDILSVDGVISVHELHIWQLSETKTVASVHVLASRDHEFMPIAHKIRNILHQKGIHSSTIQPEYVGNGESPKTAETACLVGCPADAACNPQENACCPPPAPEV